MTVQEINKLREKLEKQISKNVAYGEIYKTSREIDKLVTKYYEEKELSKRI